MTFQLTEFQQDIIKECLTMENGGGLSLPVGTGKTLLSLYLGKEYKKVHKKPFLVVCAKSLIGSWEHEIKKFFDSSMKYLVIHNSYTKNIEEIMEKDLDEIDCVLTTPEMVTKGYKEFNIDEHITYSTYNGFGYVKNYRFPSSPLRKEINNGIGLLFSTPWSSMFVDECHKYTNISAKVTRALIGVYSCKKWLLSGTIMSEPSYERIIGFHYLLYDKTIPSNVTDCQEFIKRGKYIGFKHLLVHRDKNLSYITPEINEVIIEHKLDKYEETMYESIKNFIVNISKKLQKNQKVKNKELSKKLRSKMLSSFIYLRQALICPIIPLTGTIVSSYSDSEKEDNDTLCGYILEDLNKSILKDWVKTEESVKSTRIKEILKVLEKHDERCVIFTSFRKVLEVIKYFIDREVFTLESSQSSIKRQKILDDFSKSKNGVLCLTYDIGAEGLNLQCCRNILITDFWWNCGKTHQAIGRINRYGQQAKSLNVYYFTSNVAIEKGIFDKHKVKKEAIDKIKNGERVSISKINLSFKEIVKMIDAGTNSKKLKEINYI